MPLRSPASRRPGTSAGAPSPRRPGDLRDGLPEGQQPCPGERERAPHVPLAGRQGGHHHVRDVPYVEERLALVIAALRAWFARPEAEAPAWYRALADPVVGGVLRLLQDDPAHPWTVATLAAKAGVSRAAPARRVGYGSAFALSTAFKGVYGVSPVEYRRRVA